MKKVRMRRNVAVMLVRYQRGVGHAYEVVEGRARE